MDKSEIEKIRERLEGEDEPSTIWFVDTIERLLEEVSRLEDKKCIHDIVKDYIKENDLL